MKIILSKQCEALRGCLGRGFGYYIQKRKDGFFSVRNRKGIVPHDGHWRFIEACAEMAKSKLHIADVRLSWQEVERALYEARHFQAARKVKENADAVYKKNYNAADVINLKISFGI